MESKTNHESKATDVDRKKGVPSYEAKQSREHLEKAVSCTKNRDL